MPYLGRSPTQAVRARYYYTVASGATSVTGSDDNSNTLIFSDGEFVDVSLNGVTLVAGTDYVTSTANTIGSLSAMSANDVVEVVVYDVFSVFDGNVNSDFSVGGDITVTGSLKNGSTHFNVDSSGDVILDSDTGNWRLKDAGTTIVELFHASDELYINSPVDGQNVRFNVNNGGSAIVPLKIHAEGYVVKETQPAFMAIKNADQDNIAINTATTILFQTEIYDVNANFASNTFTAPVTGKYLFAASLLLSQPAQDAEYIGIRLVTSNRNHRIGMYDFVGMDAALEYWSIKGSVIVDMDASDTAFLQFYQSSGTAQTDILQNDDTTVFTGYLLG